MKMTVFLLVSAAALLVNPAVVKPTHHKPVYNLNAIIDLAKKYNESVSKELFVEDVSHLAEGSGRCEDKFFCKAHEILYKHKREEEIVRNLNMFIIHQNFKCEEVLKQVNSTGVTIQIPQLLEHLTTCIRKRNFLGYTSSP